MAAKSVAADWPAAKIPSSSALRVADATPAIATPAAAVRMTDAPETAPLRFEANLDVAAPLQNKLANPGSVDRGGQRNRQCPKN